MLSEAKKAEIIKTLEEIREREQWFRQHGAEVADLEEWQTLHSLVARIERKLGVKSSCTK